MHTENPYNICRNFRCVLNHSLHMNHILFWVHKCVKRVHTKTYAKMHCTIHTVQKLSAERTLHTLTGYIGIVVTNVSTLANVSKRPLQFYGVFDLLGVARLDWHDLVDGERSTENTLANVNIRQLANTLLATTTHFNQALIPWCAFAWCAMKCRLYCL